MKTRNFLTLALLMLAMSASAQIQLLYMDPCGRNVIDRNKKLYWMDGDSDPCFNILNYKKTGNKETFTIKERESSYPQTYNVTITLDAKSMPTHLLLKEGKNTIHDASLKTTSGSAEEDQRMYDYFGGLAGYPKSATAGNVSAGVPSKPTAEDLKKGGVKGAANKVGDAAKGAFGKVKGLFKKKK